MGTGYVVLDLETTGFAYKSYDRVLEIAVALLDENLEIENTWTTLVNPEREVSSTSVHGISAADVYDAPRFIEISETLSQLLKGRSIIAHNANFDRSFIDMEFARAGLKLPDTEDFWFCTKKLSKWAIPGLRSYALPNLIDYLSISNVAPHVALGDCLATVELLRKICSKQNQILELLSESDGSTYQGNTDVPQRDAYPRELAAVSNSLTFIQKLVGQLPDQSSNPIEQEYEEFLEVALLDEVLSKFEVEELLEIAASSGLSVSDIQVIHSRYLERLSKIAWADGELTEAERQSLESVAKTLGLGDLEIAAAEKPIQQPLDEDWTSTSKLKPGSTICLTGKMEPNKEATGALLQKHGFTIEETFTKRISYVVAADINSLSGKAARARKNGIPVLSVEWIWSNFG